MGRFSIWIAQPKQWPHMRMFCEVAEGLAYSLRQLGHEVQYDPGNGPYITNPLPFPGTRSLGRCIILGSHFLFDTPLPEDAILYNLEQVPEKLGSPGNYDSVVANEWLTSDAIKLFRRHTVWDYSHTNIERLRRFGVEDVHYCGVGYAPCLTRIPDAEEDVDVLFYGSLGQGTRREAVLDALVHVYNDKGEPVGYRTVVDKGAERPIRVECLTGVYGKERDRWIARSKVVLNMHANNHGVAPAIWEIVRCSYLLANRKCVVSEDGGQDPELEEFARRSTAYVPLERLVDTCAALVDERVGGSLRGQSVSSAEARRGIAAAGFEAVKELDQVEMVRKALEDTEGARS